MNSIERIPQSITHKILAKASGKQYVKSGDIVTANIDVCFAHDPVIEQVRKLFYEEYGNNAKVWDPQKVVLFQDHLVPAKDLESRNLGIIMDKFAKEQNIQKYYPYGENYGVCHTVMCEDGHIKSGEIIIGTDSHSVTYGAFNAFGSGVGVIDMLNILKLGELWFKVPQIIGVKISGKLREGVSAKDIILKILQDIKMDGASYKTLEFFGETIESMSAEERITLCNMGVELGAKNAIMPYSSQMDSYLKRLGVSRETLNPIETDSDFEYDKLLQYDASEIEPMVAYPHSPDNVYTLCETAPKKIPLNQIYVGSCTGGKMEDIKMVHSIIKGKKIKSGVRMIVVPASMKIYKELVATGIASDLLDFGAVIESPGCKACYGAHGGILGDKEICVSTTNRNFRGRMGNPNSEVYLTSPYTAAHSAILGYIG